jgi:hypothetical protein
MYASALGNTFTKEVEVTTQRSAVSGFYGDYKGLWIDNDDVLITWLDARNGAKIYFNRGKGLAAASGTAVVPGTAGYSHKAVWTQSTHAFDVAGRKVPTAKGGAAKASGKSFSRPGKPGH